MARLQFRSPFICPKEPEQPAASSIRLLAVINFLRFAKTPPLPGMGKLCETFSFLHIFVAYHQRLVAGGWWLQLNAGTAA